MMACAISLGIVFGMAQRDAAPGASVACWLWPGAPPSLCRDKTRIYLLQGHFYGDLRFEAQGPRPGKPPRDGRELVLVYRMDRLPEFGTLQSVSERVAAAWRRAGWRVRGLQIDFDCPTAKLDHYARWIAAENAQFRSMGKKIDIVSVTGLGDWLVSGRQSDLHALSEAAGTIAFMFYHDDRPIEPLGAYIHALRRSSLRFKLGLLPEQRDDRRFAAARAESGYRGDIIFYGKTTRSGV